MSCCCWHSCLPDCGWQGLLHWLLLAFSCVASGLELRCRAASPWLTLLPFHCCVDVCTGVPAAVESPRA